MSWADASPVMKIVHSAKAGIDIDKDGRAKLNLSFSEPFFRELGSPERANVQFGTNENLGKLRLVPAKDGTFEVREYERGGGRIQMLLPEGISPRMRELEPCEILERPPEGVALFEGAAWIIQLPLTAWDRQGAPQPTVPAAAPRPAAPAAAPAKDKLLGALDAAVYLKKNGIKCHKLAGDWWMLEGERVPRMDVLARVNEIRKKNDLPALGLDNID